MTENGSNPETVTLTIDGREMTVPKGTTLLHAAETLGTEVPHYCYHPGLSAPAQCRLCLVEVEGSPKPMPSCVTMAMDGQVVHTQSELAKSRRRGVLEFYLVNHPLDCPVCDMSGECKLQDHVYQEGREHGRGREPKRVFGRDDFGGDVLYYGDRCVMCTRCVRFMNEVAGDPLLTVVDRGDRSVIDTFFEKGLELSGFAGNVVDICPVGALVSKDFLHKARAWDLDHTPSVCPNCSQGCNVDLHTRDNLVQRIRPRENQDVNGHWMCDYGRGNYDWINAGDRIEAPLVKGSSGNLKAMGWEEALSALAERLQAVVGGAVETVGSPFYSNESLSALKSLSSAMGSGGRAYRSPKAASEEPLPGFPDLIRRKDLAPNVDGAQRIGFSRVGNDQAEEGLDHVANHGGVLFVMGDDLVDQGDLFGSRADLFVYLGSHLSPAARNADFVLPVTLFSEEEGTFTNATGRVQRFWPAQTAPGAARPAWLILGALVQALSGEGEIPTQAAQAFNHLALTVEAFAGLAYSELGRTGALLNDPVSIAGD